MTGHSKMWTLTFKDLCVDHTLITGNKYSRHSHPLVHTCTHCGPDNIQKGDPQTAGSPGYNKKLHNSTVQESLIFEDSVFLQISVPVKFYL